MAHGLGDWELAVGVEPLEPDAVEVGDDGGGFPVGVDVGANLAPVDALADEPGGELVDGRVSAFHLLGDGGVLQDGFGARLTRTS